MFDNLLLQSAYTDGCHSATATVAQWRVKWMREILLVNLT